MVMAAVAAWPLSPVPASAREPLVVDTARKTVAVSGYTRSAAKRNVASEVAGKVLAVRYDVGQTIADKPFVEIDPTFIQFQIDQADWSLKKLEVSRKRVHSRLSYLEKEFQRIERLLSGDATTRARYDAAAEELDQAQLELLNTDLEIKTLKTRMAELKERRQRHSIILPKGWVVVDRRVEPGEIIVAGTLLARIADFERLVVPLYVSGEELAAIRQMNPLEIRIDGNPVRAVLNWVNPEFDERTRKLAIELQIQDYDGPRRGGLQVELTLEVATKGLMVPKSAVENRFDNPRVTLKDSGKSIAIIILGEDNGHVLVADQPGLSPGIELKPQGDTTP
jgi:RND family efflux transporter MFP subunit